MGGRSAVSQRTHDLTDVMRVVAPFRTIPPTEGGTATAATALAVARTPVAPGVISNVQHATSYRMKHWLGQKDLHSVECACSLDQLRLVLCSKRLHRRLLS